MPRISVVIPVFETEPYIDRCVQSILNQSEKDIEIILVDDQSSDGSFEKISSYAAKHDNIIALRTVEKGMAGGARNLGYTQAKGKYVSFIDSDDWVDNEYYYHLLKAIEQKNVDIAVCGVKREYENHKCSSVRYSYDAENVIDGKYALILLSRVIDKDVSISSIVGNKLFDKNFLERNNLAFIPNSYNEDDIFTFKALINARNVAITGEVNYHLYQRKGSTSRAFSNKHIDDLFEAFAIIRNELPPFEENTEFRNIYYAFFEKCLLYLFESMHQVENNDAALSEYIAYAYKLCGEVLLVEEFIAYCGHQRIVNFFSFQ